MLNIAINGFGRIGRLVLRAGLNDPAIEFVAINDLTDAKTLAHLFKYDSTHGKFDGEVSAVENNLVINGRKIRITAEKEAEKLPWKELKVDVVLECTGDMTKKGQAMAHIKAGARKVIISAPGKGDEPITSVVLGVNDDAIDWEKETVISNASCTTNCASPMFKVINDAFEII